MIKTCASFLILSSLIVSCAIPTGNDAFSSKNVVSGIAGTSMQGPMCGGPRACPDQPLAFARFAIFNCDALGDCSQFRETVDAAADGTFKAELPAGRYFLSVAPALDGIHPRILPAVRSQGVEVSDGKITDVVVEFDTGMR